MYNIGTFFYHLENAVSEGKARDLDEAMHIAAAAGITHIDMHIGASELHGINYLKDIMKKNGMRTASVHCAKAAHYKSEALYAQSIEGFCADAEFAREMGSPFFMLVPQAPPDFKEREFVAFRESARRLIGELCTICDGMGLVPTIEDYSSKNTAYGRPEDIKLLLDKNPELMFTYDSGNFVLAGNDELCGAQIFADRTVYVHLKDLSYDEVRTEFVRDGVAYGAEAIGDGFIRTKKALDILKDGRFKEGTVTIESGYVYDSFDKMLKSANYLQQILWEGEK